MDATSSSWTHLDLGDDSWLKDSSSFNNPHSPTARSQDPNLCRWNHTPAITDPYTTPYHYNGFINYNDFTSEQAAQALTALSHPPNKFFEDDGYPDCCQPCDQPCNSEDTFECFSVDAAPCYDERCAQRCELDGADTICNDTHTEGINDILCCLHARCDYKTTSEAELLHHCTVAHACGGRTHWDCRNQSPFGPLLSSQSHVHNEHCRDEFINPLLLHPDGCSKKPSFSTDHFSCGDFHPHIESMQFGSIRSSDEQDNSISRPFCPPPCHQTPFPAHVMDTRHHTTSPISRFVPHAHLSSLILQNKRPSLPPSEMSCTSPTSTSQDFFDSMTDCSSPSAQTYVCNWLGKETKLPCSLVFMTSLELQTHIEEYHLRIDEQIAASNKEDQLVCCWKGCSFAQTKKKWRQAQHLKDHLRTHTKHKAYQCDKCQRLFSEKKSLEQHRRIHTGEKPFKCEDCGACFSHQSTLSTHRRTHTGEKPYLCDICGHRDADHANFQRHKLIHEPAKYKCEFCGTEFKKKANMLRHQKNKACRGLKD